MLTEGEPLLQFRLLGGRRGGSNARRGKAKAETGANNFSPEFDGVCRGGALMGLGHGRSLARRAKVRAGRWTPNASMEKGPANIAGP